MPLQILKASAGSGKTYSLTESYIRYCLDDNNGLDFTNILAITFTNKASAEMKDRIIDLLHTLSHDPQKYPGIKKLSQDLTMSFDEIKVKCKQMLNRILRDFDLFTITTIDSFFTRLYGSMTLDLFGDPPRDITFDTDKALDFAAGKLIEAAQKDKELRTVMMDLLEEKIREGEGVGLQNSLKKLGKELFNDEYLQLRDHSQYIHPAQDIHKGLTQAVDLIQYNFNQYQENLKALLERGGMKHSDFFSKLIEWILNKNNLLELYKLKSFQKITDPGQWFANKNRDEMTVKVAPIQDELLTLGQEFYDYVHQQCRQYTTYSVVLDNYASYRILRFLDEAAQNYLQDQRLIFLSDINLNIHRHLSSDDALIVYEKLGQRLNAVMIDEFQDTSQIQWNNLKPLIRNNLAEGNPNLVVGDVKQAIYRFRNGNWEIMEIQVPEFQKEWVESGKSDIDSLPQNWRSSPEIVDFNNDFFKRMSESLSNLLIHFKNEHFPNTEESENSSPINQEMTTLAEAPQMIYGDTAQEVAEKNKNLTGYVEVSYWSYGEDKAKVEDKDKDKVEVEVEVEVEEEDKDEEAERMDWLRTVIDELDAEGYRGADIGVLARGKKELASLSEYFTRWSEGADHFRFSSEDSLKLDLSDGVQLLIAGLRVKAGIDTTINRMVFNNYLIKLNLTASSTKTWKDALPSNEQNEINNQEPEILQRTGIEQLSLFFESLIDETGLTETPGQWPYLLSFIEEVKKFELQYGPDVTLFLEDWEERIRNIRIQMSDDAEKIRLFTIHKSKGLEFEIVLLPFGGWDFEISGKQNILWVEDRQDQLLKLAGPLPVSYKGDLIYSSFDYALMSEYMRNVIDNLNLLYVAMTRPKKRLYIRLQEKVRKRSKTLKDFDKPVNNTLDLFQMVFENLDDSPITRGSKTPKSFNSESYEKAEKEKLRTYHIRHESLPLHLRPSFDGSSNESIGQGLIIHHMLEEVEYARDIHVAISKSILSGDLREKDRPVWTAKLRGIIEYGPVVDFYSETWNVYNEKSIMVVGGGEYRPDRIQENGKEYIVIDYKTGDPSPNHQKQIRNYKSIIGNMVDLPVRSFIYYPLIPNLVEIR